MGSFLSIAVTNITTAISFTALSLCAQTNGPRMEKRMENQERRTDHGVKSGEQWIVRHHNPLKLLRVMRLDDRQSCE
jgi:hypothetical protein